MLKKPSNFVLGRCSASTYGKEYTSRRFAPFGLAWAKASLGKSIAKQSVDGRVR